jgi:hypothetical protein
MLSNPELYQDGTIMIYRLSKKTYLGFCPRLPRQWLHRQKREPEVPSFQDHLRRQDVPPIELEIKSAPDPVEKEENPSSLRPANRSIHPMTPYSTLRDYNYPQLDLLESSWQ